jgi:hypothetical protein
VRTCKKNLRNGHDEDLAFLDESVEMRKSTDSKKVAIGRTRAVTSRCKKITLRPHSKPKRQQCQHLGPDYRTSSAETNKCNKARPLPHHKQHVPDLKINSNTQAGSHPLGSCKEEVL